MEQEFKKTYNLVKQNILFELFLPENKQFMNKTKSFLSEVQSLNQKFEISEKLQKRIYFLNSELIQALVHNAIFQNDLFSNCIKLSKVDSCFYLISENLIDNNKISRTKLKLDEVNSSFDAVDSEAELKHKSLRLKNTPMMKKGISVGLLDLARRSMNKLLYKFENISEEYSIFSLILTVDIE